MIILSIETSCDETGVAIVESKGVFNHRIIINLLASQVKVHKKYGGVVPGLAAREHVKNLPLLIKKALKEYRGGFDAIAYTDHPGLEPALLVGKTFAKTLAYAWNIPVHPINHLYGHIFVNFANKTIDNLHLTIDKLFPAIALVISGGHTQLYKISTFHKIELLGQTVDDAVGEALDKGARLLGLGYPGGPEIEKLARKGKEGMFTFPSPMVSSSDLNFSFSGLKTALLYRVRDLEGERKNIDKNIKVSLSLAYQKAAFGSLIEKTKRALGESNARSLFIGGGVGANQALRQNFEALIKTQFPSVKLFIPPPEFCTDNAVMIALAHSIPALQKAISGRVKRAIQ